MRGCGFVDDAPAAHRGACRGQRYALPTAHPFAHKLHSHLLRLKQRSQNPGITSPNYNQSAQHRPRSRSPECPVTMPESPVTFAGIRIRGVLTCSGCTHGEILAVPLRARAHGSNERADLFNRNSRLPFPLRSIAVYSRRAPPWTNCVRHSRSRIGRGTLDVGYWKSMGLAVWAWHHFGSLRGCPWKEAQRLNQRASSSAGVTLSLGANCHAIGIQSRSPGQCTRVRQSACGAKESGRSSGILQW